MLCEKGYLLIKELDRNRELLPPYNKDLVTEIDKEIKEMVSANNADAQEEDSRSSEAALMSLVPTIRVRHTCIKRNVRCLMAYHYNRLKSLRSMRWQFGSILPAEVKQNLSASETEWFAQYSTSLVKYMRTICPGGLNLALNLKPPKYLYIEVKCLVDYGQLELNDGSMVLLKKDTRHYLPRTECEELIHKGILEHIV